MRNVIIVTGTPGTGKTALSKELAKAIGARYINLTQFVSKRGLYSGIDRERRTKIMDLARTRSTLTRELRGVSGSVIVDTHNPEGILPREMVRQVFVLRCHPRILEARLRAKKWKANKIRENVLAEIVDACLIAAVKQYGSRRVIQVDTSRRSVEQSVRRVRRSILGERGGRMSVNWLETLEKEGQLDRYLKG